MRGVYQKVYWAWHEFSNVECAVWQSCLVEESSDAARMRQARPSPSLASRARMGAKNEPRTEATSPLPHPSTPFNTCSRASMFLCLLDELTLWTCTAIGITPSDAFDFVQAPSSLTPPLTKTLSNLDSSAKTGSTDRYNRCCMLHTCHIGLGKVPNGRLCL